MVAPRLITLMAAAGVLTCGGVAVSDPQGAGGASCGGEVSPACPDGTWCDFPDDTCGGRPAGTDPPGLCKPAPPGCDEIFDPVCACDGMVYGNECEANRAGSDLSYWGACTPPPEMFRCGVRFCNLGSQYCELSVYYAGFDPGTTCQPLPPACGGPAASCDCMTDLPCNCSGGAMGLFLTCG